MRWINGLRCLTHYAYYICKLLQQLCISKHLPFRFNYLETCVYTYLIYFYMYTCKNEKCISKFSQRLFLGVNFVLDIVSNWFQKMHIFLVERAGFRAMGLWSQHSTCMMASERGARDEQFSVTSMCNPHPIPLKSIWN